MEKELKTINIWRILLTIGFLVATYEHSYWVLHLYSADMTYNSINFSHLTMFWIVFVVDGVIYFSFMFIAFANNYNIQALPGWILLGMSLTSSILLNTRYMLRNMPDGAVVGYNFETIIAVFIGITIPMSLGVLGWITSILSQFSIDKNRTKKKERQVSGARRKNKRISQRMSMASETN